MRRTGEGWRSSQSRSTSRCVVVSVIGYPFHLRDTGIRRKRTIVQLSFVGRDPVKMTGPVQGYSARDRHRSEGELGMLAMMSVATKKSMTYRGLIGGHMARSVTTRTG